MDHLASFIDPALAEGKDVVCDRYALGTLAYQSWSDEDQGWIKGLNLRAQHPDMTIFLSLPVEMALKRISGRGNLDIFENQEVLERVVLNFRTALSDAMADGQEIAVVNGTDPVETVADNVWWNVERILQP
jgi:dTMP kinase